MTRVTVPLKTVAENLPKLNGTGRETAWRLAETRLPAGEHPKGLGHAAAP